MTELKLMLVALVTLTLAACGSPEPNEPFLGKWSLDKVMTLQNNRGLPTKIISFYQDRLQQSKIDISESEVTTMMITTRNLSEYDRKRKYQKMFANSDATDQQEDASIEREQSKASYSFGESTVTVEIEGQKKITTLDFTFIPDPAKLTLKLSRPDGYFPSRFTLRREGEYMIYRIPVDDAGKKMDIYFIRDEG